MRSGSTTVAEPIAYRALRESRFRWSAWCQHPIHPDTWVWMGNRITRSRALSLGRRCALNFEGIRSLVVDGGEMLRLANQATEGIFGRFAETFGVELPDA